MNLKIAAFGKIKTPGLREALDHYLRNLKPWIQIEELELKALAVPDKSPATRARIQREEGKILMDRLAPSLGARGILILLDEEGKALPSREWAAQLREWEREGVREACFAIGGSLGFSAETRERARKVLGFGPQTLPHELARVVLGEQLYRAYSLLNGHRYHNEGKGVNSEAWLRTPAAKRS